MAAADIDGNGQRDLVASFGPAYGIWAWMNSTSWVELFDVTRLFEGTGRHQLAMALVASVLAPLAEEVAFRGVVFGLFRPVMGNARAAHVTAAAFGAWHVIPTYQALRGSPVSEMVATVPGVAVGALLTVGILVVATVVAATPRQGRTPLTPSHG